MRRIPAGINPNGVYASTPFVSAYLSFCVIVAQIFRNDSVFEPKTAAFGSEESRQVGEDVFVVLRLLFLRQFRVCRRKFHRSRSDKGNL